LKKEEAAGVGEEITAEEGVKGENSSIFQVLNMKSLQQMSLHASLHLIRAEIQ